MPPADRAPAPDAAPEVILDCRSEEEFARGHLAGSGNVPLADLAARRHELPPRETRVLVVAGDGDAAAHAAETLRTLGYAHVRHLSQPVAEVPGGLADRSPPATLWRPSPFLASLVGHLPRGKALDLAAGAGREAVYLAQHGFTVEAWDHAPEALERAAALAARCGVRIRTRVVDLERTGASLPQGCFNLVTVFRFLHRPLLPAIERALAPGGHLVYETFRRGQERHGRPTHPRFLFWPGELAAAFPGLEVLHYEESDPPGGPIMARLHARRPS